QHRLQHVHVAVIDERFLKIEEPAADVAEMDVEDLLASAEPADDVEDLIARLLEHLSDRTLAEVEAVVRALGDGDEPLEAFDAAEHGLDALKSAAARPPGI